jgi:hypothetical protein
LLCCDWLQINPSLALKCIQFSQLVEVFYVVIGCKSTPLILNLKSFDFLL